MAALECNAIADKWHGWYGVHVLHCQTNDLGQVKVFEGVKFVLRFKERSPFVEPLVGLFPVDVLMRNNAGGRRAHLSV